MNFMLQMVVTSPRYVRSKHTGLPLPAQAAALPGRRNPTSVSSRFSSRAHLLVLLLRLGCMKDGLSATISPTPAGHI
jgi:hypothetical protein